MHPTTNILTKFFVISDTHGEPLQRMFNAEDIDVAIHCGDLTEESKIDEYKASIDLLKQIQAPLKLVIAGNHDFSMDIPIFKKKIAHANFEKDLIEREYGAFGKARELFDTDDTKAAGIVFLDEGKST